MKPGRLSRRRFFCIAAAAGGGAVVAGCGAAPRSAGRPLRPRDGDAGHRAPVGELAFRPASAERFPEIDAAGDPREIGRAVGRRFGAQIRAGLERRGEWFRGLVEYATGIEGRAAMEVFEAAARKHAPAAFAELEGWAAGAEIPLGELLVLNHKAELAALRDLQPPRAQAGETPGCSTIVLAAGGRLHHLHNEDGHDAYRDLMFVIRARPSDAPAYVCLSYPGVLPGNAPAMNARGLCQTTNFIACKEVRLGVGRYFLDRMVLTARSIDEAIEWSAHPERAYGYHHVFSDLGARRAVGIEVTPTRSETREIDGLYLHTNHLVLDGTRDAPQDEGYVSSSSASRWQVLARWRDGVADPAALSAGELLAPLASHEQRPYSPCRHPEGDVHGFTLATAVLDADAPGRLRLHKGQPCRGVVGDVDAAGWFAAPGSGGTSGA